MCLCLHVHKGIRAPRLHLKAGLFLSDGLWVCVVLWYSMADKGLAIDWGPVSQQPLSYVKGVDGSQSTRESQHFLPLPTPPGWRTCREKSHCGSHNRPGSTMPVSQPRTTHRANQVEYLWACICFVKQAVWTLFNRTIECVSITCVLGGRCAMQWDQNKRKGRKKL